MSQRISGFSLTVIGLLLAALGIVSPIIWNWYSKKSELSLIKGDNASLVEKKTSVDGLLVTYNGRVVDSLIKTTFTLKNTGRTPIVENDLVSLPLITVDGGEILNATIDKVYPNNIEAKLTTLDVHRVAVSFPLLNPGDSISFGLLINGNEPKFSAEARVKNISQIQLLDEASQFKVKASIGWSVYVVTFFVFVFILVFFQLLSEVPIRKRALLSLQRGVSPVREGELTSVIIGYIESDLRFLEAKKRKELVALTSSCGDSLTKDGSVELLSRMRMYVESNNPLGGAFVILLFIVFGAYYIYGNVVG